jgi:hypothetical protein
MKTKRTTRRPRSSVYASATLHAGVAASLLVGELACGHGAPVPPEAQQATATAPAATSAPPPVASVAAAPEEPDGGAALRAYVVAPPKLARRTLYTWTTEAQIKELARDPTLLTRTESAKHGASYFDQIVDDRAKRGDALAAVLRTSPFVRARYTWPAPFATFGGWPGEVYGGQLLRIDLKPTAWIAVLRTSRLGWDIVDLDDRPVELAEVLLHPERIAAVHFIHDAPGSGSYRTSAGPLERAAFREYVVCNESMIASWSTGTDAIAAEIGAEADALAAFARHLRKHPARAESLVAWNARIALEVWPSTSVPLAPETTYEATLAFPNQGYLPDAEALLALAEALRKVVPRGAPGVEHHPTAVFKASAKVVPLPAPKPPRPKPHGTY